MSVLVFIDQSEGVIAKSSHEAASYGAALAEKMGTTADGIVLGNTTDDLTTLGNHGLKNIHTVADAALNSMDAAVYSNVLAQAAAGYDVIFANRDRIVLPNEIQSNQYGIRFPVIVDGTTIKFEMVCEGRIQFDEPSYPSWSPVPCLNQVDSIAEKLLANADRWPSDRVNSRDLIDLAIQRLASDLPQKAIDKAEAAYQVMEPLGRSIQYFQERPEYREKCYEILSIAQPNKVIDGIDLLAQDLGREITVRTFSETISSFPSKLED